MEDSNKLKEVQKICLELLIEVDRICKKNNIKYFLYGGTLLGAVRHKGFIPWDDDVDLVMFREDYEKFLSVLENDLSDKYFMQTLDTEPLSMVTWGKLHKRNTAFVHSIVPKKCFQGIAIDIFALDNAPKNDKILKILSIAHRCSNIIFTERFRIQPKNKKIKRRVLDIFINCTKVIKDDKFKKLYEKRDKIYNKKDSIYVVHNSFRKYTSKVMPKEYFNDTILLDFEGHKFRSPKRYEELLTLYYGKDYMKLPPKEERAYHPAEIIDVENSWEKYVCQGD